MQNDKPESEASTAQSQPVDKPEIVDVPPSPWPPGPPKPIPDPGPPPPPTSIPPGLYTITLDGFTAPTIRSGNLTEKWGSDTDYVSMAAQVNSQSPVTAARGVGDIPNGGGASPNLQLGPLSVGPTDTLTLTYLIVNKGSGDTQQIIDGVAVAAVQLLGKTLGVSQTWITVADAILTAGLNIAFPDCDGTVVADKLVFSGNDLANMTATPNGDHSANPEYPGSNSPWGCGDNSDYLVTWDIQRVPPPPLPHPVPDPFPPIGR